MSKADAASTSKKCDRCGLEWPAAAFIRPCDAERTVQPRCAQCVIFDAISHRCRFGDNAIVDSKCRATLECLFHLQLRLSADNLCFVPPGRPLDMQSRFGSMNASAISAWLGTSKWKTLDDALPDAFQIEKNVDAEAKRCMAEGHEYQPILGAIYLKLRRATAGKRLRLGEPHPRTYGRFPVLRATADYAVLDNDDEGKAVGLVEIKRWAGARRTTKVDFDADPDIVREYEDQCQLQMLCYDLPFVDLVVGSDGDGTQDPVTGARMSVDYKRILRDPSWWPKWESRLASLYDEYLRWFWEEDRSPETTASIRSWLGRQGLTADRVSEFLRRTPCPGQWLSAGELRMRRHGLQMASLGTPVDAPPRS